LHTDIWRTLTADEKADAPRLQFMAHEALIRGLLAATGVRLVDSSTDADEESS
jgi:hypothetical protein